MSTRLILSSVVAAATLVAAQHESAADSPGNAVCSPAQIDHVFKYEDLPYKVGPLDNAGAAKRGLQHGYNICNSTTEGPESMCQTAFINSIDDFCLWAPGEPGSTVGDVEGEMVSWCTKGHGARLIPAGAITGVQFLTAPAYVQISGKIDQAKINLAADDFGGEMDPHGADLCGNPMGGMVYSSAWGPKDGSQYQQAIEWHNFIGSGSFCFKACDPNGQDDANYCQHIFDRIGCDYNAPAKYEEGVFESCESDNQLFPGVYVEDGVTKTYTQPPESLGAITTIPYKPFKPSSSECKTFESASIFSALGSATSAAPNSTSTAASSGATSTSGAFSSSGASGASGASGSSSGVGAAGARASSSSTNSTSTSGAQGAAGLSGVAVLAGVAAFLL